MAKKKPDPVVTDASLHIFPPAVRIFTDWNPSKIRAVEFAAERGMMLQVVTLCEWMLTDDRVASTLDSRCDALLGLSPNFEAGVGRQKEKAVKALEADEDFFEAYPESELKRFLLWGILLGVAPGRHRWTVSEDHGGRLLPMPQFWHPQHLHWDWYLRQWTVRDRFSAQIVINAGDGEWILHTPGGAERPWANGLWRSLAPWVLLKRYAMRDIARHSEKAARTVVTSPDGATKDDRAELSQMIQTAGADAVIGLPNGFDYKLVEATANTRDLYQAQIDLANEAITIRIRGGNLTTKVEGGSKAATETQAKQNDQPKLQSDALGLSTTLHDQSLVYWAEYNFGDKRLAPWPSYPVEPEEDKAQRATMVQTLMTGLTTADKLGFDIDPEATIDEFGLTFLKGRSRERAPDPVPGQPGGQQGEEADEGDSRKDGPGEEATEPAPKPVKGKARALDVRPRLASGDDPAKTPGFLSGQLYSDDLADDATARCGKALEGTLLSELLSVIQSANGYDEVRAAVLAKYREAKQPHEVRELTAHALVLSQLAGAYAVREDAT